MDDGEPSSATINVYHMKEDSHIIGWLVLSFLLTLGIIILLMVWVFSLWNNNNVPPRSVCFGPFGVETGVDANALVQCGTNRDETCTFRKRSIADCEAECNVLQEICQAFTFNETTSTMKIVNRNNTFRSPQSNLFVRQSGMVS